MLRARGCGGHRLGHVANATAPSDVGDRPGYVQVPKSGLRRTALGSPGGGRSLQAARDLDEQIVAGVVAEAVVDALEPVEIEEQHRQRRGPPARAADRDVQAVEEQDAVRQAGQRIVDRLVGEPGRRALALDRVADRPAQGIGVGRLEQVVLGARVDRAQGDRLLAVSASTTTGTSGALDRTASIASAPSSATWSTTQSTGSSRRTRRARGMVSWGSTSICPPTPSLSRSSTAAVCSRSC